MRVGDISRFGRKIVYFGRFGRIIVWFGRKLYSLHSINARALEHENAMVDAYTKLKPDSFK